MACKTTLLVLVNVDNGSCLTEDKVILLLEFFFLYMVSRILLSLYGVQCVVCASRKCGMCVYAYACLYAIMYVLMYSEVLFVSTHSWFAHTPS